MPSLAITLTLISTFFHAGWNIVARENKGREVFLRVYFLIMVFGLLPSILVELHLTSFPLSAIKYIFISGVFFSLYSFGLASGYTNGDFSVVYPLARAIPILFIALIDLASGHPPLGLGWFGLTLVIIGCILTPLKSLKDYSLSVYWNRTTLWILLAAIGTLGYTIFDNLAADLIQPGIFSAMRYNIFEVSVGFFVYWFLLNISNLGSLQFKNWKSWKGPGVIAILLFSTYSLVLFALQISLNTSYIFAVRQFSIVIGVVFAALFFKERVPLVRFAAVIIISLGIILITLAG